MCDNLAPVKDCDHHKNPIKWIPGFSTIQNSWKSIKSYMVIYENIQVTESATEVYVWEVSSGSESVRLLARQAENSTSGWGSFRERSPLGSWFSTSVFRNVRRVVPENVRICGFRRNLSNLDSAPIMRDSVLLNS